MHLYRARGGAVVAWRQGETASGPPPTLTAGRRLRWQLVARGTHAHEWFAQSEPAAPSPPGTARPRGHWLLIGRGRRGTVWVSRATQLQVTATLFDLDVGDDQFSASAGVSLPVVVNVADLDVGDDTLTTLVTAVAPTSFATLSVLDVDVGDDAFAARAAVRDAGTAAGAFLYTVPPEYRLLPIQ